MIYRDISEGLFFALGNYNALNQSGNGRWMIVGNRGIYFYNQNIKEYPDIFIPPSKNDVDRTDKYLNNYNDKHQLIDLTFKDE